MHFHFRIGNNDDLMKIHNEIFEQKSKVERAGRELKGARKSMVQKIGDRGYVRTFEVNAIVNVVANIGEMSFIHRNEQNFYGIFDKK